MSFTFCPDCGARFKELSADAFAPQKCAQCGRTHYHESKPCAGALIVRDRRVLLVRRAIEPFKDYWDIPGGFLEPGEHPLDGMLREVREETGLDVRVIKLFGVYMDHYDNNGREIFTLNHYYVVEPTGGTPRAADDASELHWFSPNELPNRIAFEHARRVLCDLREKMMK
jgi:ADP-ribose pyrophosphatase YjhB (NUDIX family)